MIDFDVFNGDADGICALQQLRLAEPRKATLITGIKRDINLHIPPDELFHHFPAGGGRKAAAGINHLPEEALDQFIAEFISAFY